MDHYRTYGAAVGGAAAGAVCCGEHAHGTVCRRGDHEESGARSGGSGKKRALFSCIGMRISAY